MELINSTLYLKRTYTVKKGDRIIGCQVTAALGVDPALDVPADLINGKDYVIHENIVVQLPTRPDKEPEGLVYQ